ncbi:MAG TPA: phosphate transport system regulatory protein PhoU [Ruminococcus sp.]|nr:phosphate transport system regulatory protein PhoU [Ruminococcus sp.]HCR73323.1 phosphate transport system regulatory protein PhoU [Ruminococcus sp.]
MRDKFDMQLEKLNNELIEMGALCESAIAGAVKALFNYDMTLVQSTIDTEHEIDRKEKVIESMCLKLLLQQQPVARDLRTVSSALKMITDMERIGDQASDIAEIVKIHDLSDEKHNAHIRKMAESTIKMVTESVDAFVNKDISLAMSVIDYDDEVDDLFVKIKNDIIELIAENPENGEKAIDVLMIAKYLERIGDHATNIAEWVVFSINGIHKEN